ncbi:MAG: CatB-related O-acetyltransferase [Clostridia bacterium]|nr:CatB-related O-acetyltransferase [Clostridia bacterium]
MISYVFSRILTRMSVKAIKNSKIDKNAKLIGKVSVINSTIGRYSYINSGSSLINTDVGSFCSIASGCSIGGAAHPTDWLSSSPVFHSGRNVFGKHFSEHPFNPYAKTTIGNDVWIGLKVMVKAGVKIGNGAIIGMGSVVTKDIPDYEIWAGNPAKKIRDRFDDETKEKLLKLKWWEMNEDELTKYAADANNLEKLLKETEK